MNINRYQTTNLISGSYSKVNDDGSKTEESEKLQRTTLVDWLKQDQKNEKTDAFTLERPAEGALNLEPIERYRYMQNQGRKYSGLNNSYNDPQKALEKANEIINSAILPPGQDNPDMAELTQALQIRQLMQGKLDLAA